MGSHLGIKLGTFRTEGRALLNRLSANPCSMLYSLQKSRTSCFVILIITIAVAKSKHFSYHEVFLDVSAHGNVQLVGNCSCAVLTVTSWTCIVDCQCVRLQKSWCKVLIQDLNLYTLLYDQVIFHPFFGQFSFLILLNELSLNLK